MHELTTPCSPELNGRAERLNVTLLDMVRSMTMGLNEKNEMMRLLQVFPLNDLDLIKRV